MSIDKHHVVLTVETAEQVTALQKVLEEVFYDELVAAIESDTIEIESYSDTERRDLLGLYKKALDKCSIELAESLGDADAEWAASPCKRLVEDASC